MDENQEAGVEAEDSQAPEDGQVVETDTEGATAQEEDSTDWKAIAEAEREKAENYKLALTQKRQLLGKIPPTPPEEEDEDAPLTKKDFARLLNETVVPLVTTSKEDSLLQKIVDPAKRLYIKQLLETRIVRTGTSDEDIQNDIDAALAIADSKKKDKVISELARAAQNKPPVPSAGPSTEKPLEQKQYKWTAEQARALDARAKILNVDPEKFKKDAWDNQKKTRVL